MVMINRRFFPFALFLTIILGCRSQNEKPVLCQIYLEPILGFDLAIGTNKKDVWDISNYEKVSGSKLKYTPKDIESYTATKHINLPNGKESKVKFNLHFKEGLLWGYNLTFPIGKDYKYFWELVGYLKEYDKDKINAFIYDAHEKKPSYIDLHDRQCKRVFNVERGADDNRIFEVICRVN